MKYNKFLKTFLMIFLFLGTITFAFGCDKNDNHEHNFSSAWSKDDVNHWHDCVDENCEEKNDLSNHTYGSWELLPYEQAPIGMMVEKRICSVCGHEDKRIINKAYSFENAYEINLSIEEYHSYVVEEGRTYYFSLVGDANLSKIMHIYKENYSPDVVMKVVEYDSSKIKGSTYMYYTEINFVTVHGGDYIEITALNSGRIVFDFN